MSGRYYFELRTTEIEFSRVDISHQSESFYHISMPNTHARRSAVDARASTGYPWKVKQKFQAIFQGKPSN